MSRTASELSSPEKISKEHDFSSSNSGEPVLDDWLRRRALANEDRGASRTYVVRSKQRNADAPGRVRRNMPDPIPVMVLGRLAVDKDFQNRGIGPGLLRDAVLRTVQAAEIAGIRAILVHALSQTAKRFYLKHGFVECPINPMTLIIAVTEAKYVLKLFGVHRNTGQ